MALVSGSIKLFINSIGVTSRRALNEKFAIFNFAIFSQ